MAFSSLLFNIQRKSTFHYQHFFQTITLSTHHLYKTFESEPFISSHALTTKRYYIPKWQKRLSRILESKHYPPPPQHNPNSYEIFFKTPNGEFVSKTVTDPDQSYSSSTPTKNFEQSPSNLILTDSSITESHQLKINSPSFSSNEVSETSHFHRPTIDSKEQHHPLFPPRLAFVPPKPIISSELQSLKPIWRSRRAGLLAYKLGCIGVWNEWGERICLTVCQVDRCSVLEKKTISTHGYEAIVLGCGYKPLTQQSKPNIGKFMKVQTGPKDHIAEFKCTSDALLPVGHEMSVRHFTPGQWVFVSGWTKGKGFMGVMKRWGFAGGNKSHGTEHKAHSAPGSISQGKSVNIVWKFKKMAGHHGPDPRVVNSKVFRIEAERNLLFLTGALPGKRGSLVKISDARGKTCARNKGISIPFPTFIPKIGKPYPTTIQTTPSQTDPFAFPDITVYEY